MAFSAKNQTNPAVIDATGYAPYIKARAERADSMGSCGVQANRRAQAIRDFWQRKHYMDEITEYTERHRRDLFRSRWECGADRKALYSRVQWEMDNVLAEMNEDLERRRDRLTELLRAEESGYLNEMESTATEDPAERSSRMLKRFDELKLKKRLEEERLASEKKEQQFRQNCDELRSCLSRKIQMEIADEGRRVATEKNRDLQQHRQEDDMYAELWRKDSEAKKAREEEERKERRRKDAELGTHLSNQMLMNSLQRRAKLAEKEGEAVLMEEENRLADIEDQLKEEEKRRKQAEVKEDLEKCIKAKLKRRAQEVQDDLLQDLFFMRQISEGKDRAEKSEKKRSLMREQQLYLKYLEDQMKAEAEFEKEVDRAYRDELEKIWTKKEREWAEEKQKRRQLEKNVLAQVESQIRTNLEKCQKVQEMNKLYAQRVLDEDEEDRKKEKETLRVIRERNIAHQRELLGQIKEKEEKLKEEELRRKAELEVIRREKEAKEKKIQSLLSEMRIEREHPFRVYSRQFC